MNILSLILNSLGGFNDLLKTALGSREARDTSAAGENEAAMQQYAAEFAPRAQRTWFDSAVDGINRLQRPTYTFSVLSLFWMAYQNPAEFAQIMYGLALIPEPFWVIIGMIVGFLFSSRMIEKLPVGKAFRGIAPEDLERLRTAAALPPPAVKNPAIAAWKATKR